MAVPFIDLRRFETDFMDRWLERCRQVSEATAFVGGPWVTRLEQRMATETGCSAVVGCANGTDALQLALRALEVGPGDTVVLPDATFWATFEAVVNVGARPVTVDVDPADLEMDFELFRQALDEHQPKAAILVHLYGWGSARLDDFRALCRRRGVALIEDGAQSYGTRWQGKSIYRDALIATVSFYPAKVLGAAGDAGAVLCSSPELAETVRCLGNHGRSSHYEHGLVGWNSRMAGLDAAYLDLCLDYLDNRLESRRRAKQLYRQRLAEFGLNTIEAPAGYVDNGYLSVLRLDPAEREGLASALRDAEIGYGTVYPGAMSKQPGAAPWIAGQRGGEEADRLCRGVINLPLFNYITTAEVDEVLTVVGQAVTAGTFSPC